MKWLGLLALAPVILTGCFLTDFRTVARPQTEEPDPAKVSARTIGDVCAEFENASHMVVSGYGLVTGLDGTGGPTPPCDARTAIVERLKRAKKDENPSDIIDSPNNAVVIVTAIVKPGVRRDDLVDVEVTLPQGSKVKSLRGGILLPTPLMTFATLGEVREYLKQNELGTVSDGNRMLRGHEVVTAKGPLQAALTESEGSSDPDQPLTRAFVWKGGKLIDGRPLYLVLKTDHQRFRVAEQVALRLNETFHAGESAASKIAIARHKDLVAVAVPPRYRLNRPHYMRVVWAVPLAPAGEQDEYLKQLEERLQQPATTLSAAVALEAAGNPAVPILKSALQSEYPLVRFAAAEALAYLGQLAGAEVLRQTAAEHPALQAYALTALAAIDDAVGMAKLEELLAVKDPEVRYGAFRALREVDPSASAIRGAWAGRAFAIHEVTVPGPSLIHMLREGRAEFVLFGQRPKMVAPFSLTAGPEITLTARPGDTVVTISRFSPKAGDEPTHVQCSPAVADVLRKLAELGATYADAADMLTRAHERNALDCKLAVDALPKAVPVKRLAEAAREDPRLEQEYDLLAEVAAAEAGSLFETPTPERRKE